ncbi:DUF58 domain-containing protein [Schumannella soli]|uniref:DUF58 domain-containing protein n=1 Tax=Schumannella soli TaxID=2590779 RepID=UPI002104878A|nr:DUF58 domain-containing protein [Schumannella soli]
MSGSGSPRSTGSPRGPAQRTGTRPLDPHTRTDTLSNTRTRLVGARTGVLADGVVGVVRVGRRVGAAVGEVGRRVSSVVTPLGWIVLALLVAAGLVGYVLLGWVEAVVLFWIAVVLVLVAVVSLIGRNAFAVTLELERHKVVVGEPATAAISVRSTGSHRSLGATAEIPVGEGLAEAAIPSLRRDAVHRHEFAVPTARRGVVPIGPVHTVRADPIGLVRRELIWTGREQLVVHPRTIAVPSTSTGLIRDLEGAATTDLTPSDVSFHALREYQAGDDRRYIHWKSTAKTGTYMVRQFEQTRRSHLVVGLSTARGDFLDDEEFELAVSVAGSLGVRAIRDGRTVSVVVGEKTPEFAKRRVYAVRPLSTVRPGRLLDDLAVVASDENALPVRDVARVISDTVTGVSIAFLVTGSPTPLAELRAASAAFPADVEVVAVVCDPDARPGLRRVPGLNVLRVGLLDDLRQALARAAAVS